MKKLRLAYFGSPDFSAEFLGKIHRDDSLPVEIALVVTQKDKPVGRDQTITPSAVKQVALAQNIEVLHDVTPEDLTSRDIDLGLVFAYGRILKEELLRASKNGFWNVHPSFLPQFRGATPTVYPIILGEDQTGISLMLMDADMDHGPIIDQKTYPITSSQTHIQLLHELASIGFTLFAEHVTRLAQSGIDYSTLPVQNHAVATFTRMLEKEDGFIELNLLQKAIRKERVTSAEMPLIIQQYLGKNNITEYPIPYAPYIVYNMHRGLNPWPGVWTTLPDGKRLKILDVALNGEELVVKTVQLEGKKPVSFEQFQEAYHVV